MIWCYDLVLESAPQGRRQLQLSFPKIGCLQFIAQLSPPTLTDFVFFLRFFDFFVNKKMWADFFWITFFDQNFRFLKSSIFHEFSTFFDFSTFSIFLEFSIFFESKIFSDRKKIRADKFSEHIFFQTRKILLPLFLTHTTHCTANLCPCREIRSSDLLVVLNRRRSL